MTFNSKHELTKKAVEIAKEKHPDEFNKDQMIRARKEVYDGYGEVAVRGGYKPIRTMEDVSNCGNAMAFIDGHYPVGMSVCFVVGINGDCGNNCPQFIAGDCESLVDTFSRLEVQIDLERDGWEDEDIRDILDHYYGEEDE